jgi:hypothetical protein
MRYFDSSAKTDDGFCKVDTPVQKRSPKKDDSEEAADTKKQPKLYKGLPHYEVDFEYQQYSPTESDWEQALTIISSSTENDLVPAIEAVVAQPAPRHHRAVTKIQSVAPDFSKFRRAIQDKASDTIASDSTADAREDYSGPMGRDESGGETQQSKSSVI